MRNKPGFTKTHLNTDSQTRALKSGHTEGNFITVCILETLKRVLWQTREENPQVYKGLNEILNDIKLLSALTRGFVFCTFKSPCISGIY